MMGTDWDLMWKYSLDWREGEPSRGWRLVVVPIHSLLARSNFYSSIPQFGRWKQLPTLTSITLEERQKLGPDWQEQWKTKPDELSIPQVLKILQAEGDRHLEGPKGFSVIHLSP